MAQGDIQGRAVTSVSNPRSKKVCDRCGTWWCRDQIYQQMEYYGTSLKWTGYLVCRDCLDDPQPQLIPIILPPDPVPIWQPRQEAFSNDYRLSGFTQYLLFQVDDAEQPVVTILAALALLSKVPTPASYTDFSNTIFSANTSQLVIPPNVAWTWMAFYNPSNPQLQVALGNAVWGNPANLVLGPGEAILALAPNISAGQLNVIGLIPGIPFNAWAAPPGPEYLVTEGGEVITTEGGQGILI